MSHDNLNHYWYGIKLLAGILLILTGVWAALDISWRAYEFRDDDPDRGAITRAIDKFGGRFPRVVYLDQGWSPSDSLWFYTVTQGSNLLPYSFFLVLEQADSNQLFRSDERAPQPDGTILPALTKEQRLDLLEYLKTL